MGVFDRQAQTAMKPAIDAIARRLAKSGIGPNAVTSIGLAIGLGAASAIALGHPLPALALIVVSRLADGLDGAVARVSDRRTRLGGFLDIVFDFVFYGAIPLAFAILDPAANAVASSVLLLTFYANGGSVLAYAVMAEQAGRSDGGEASAGRSRAGLSDAARGGKALLFTTGLMEGGETLVFFVMFCLLPGGFAELAYCFAALTVWTFVFRVRLAVLSFSDRVPPA